jgi:hypothetical protein
MKFGEVATAWKVTVLSGEDAPSRREAIEYWQLKIGH